MTVEIRPTASAFQAGDAAIVNRAGNPATVVLGSAATKAEGDFIASDGGTELATKATPIAADQVLVFDSAAEDVPKVAPVSFFAAAATSILTFDADGNASAARPSHAGPVYWLNSPTQPVNWITGDIWMEPS